MGKFKSIMFVFSLCSLFCLFSCSQSANLASEDNFDTASDSSSSLKATSVHAYPTTGLTGLIGFAKLGNVTGGTGGTVTYVNTLSELTTAVAGSTSGIVVINTSISASTLQKVYLGSNKTIIGAYGYNTLTNIHFRATSSSKNIIFQNLIFSHSQSINGNDDIQLYLNYGNKYWIDHCTWTGHSWTATDASLDKLIYIGDYADYATISNCYFSNHKYGSIFGHPQDDNNSSYNGYPHLTICFNRYYNIEVRSPGLMRYGYFHAFDNYIDSFNLGFTIAQNAKVISEDNYFGTGSANKGMLDDKNNNTTFTDNNSYPSITNQTSPQSTWTASSNYSYTLWTPSNAKTWTSSYAGAQTSSSKFVFPY